MKMKYRYEPDTGLVIGRGNRPIGVVSNKGYLRTNIGDKKVSLHRLAFELMGVDIPEGMEIDHINHNRSDNRWSNLRLVTHSENQRNASKRKDNTSGVVGVNWNKQFKRWSARIHVDGRRINLGTFTEFSKAVDPRKNAEVLYGFHDNHGKDVA